MKEKSSTYTGNEHMANFADATDAGKRPRPTIDHWHAALCPRAGLQVTQVPTANFYPDVFLAPSRESTFLSSLWKSMVSPCK
jgi:hypothetical protein